MGKKRSTTTWSLVRFFKMSDEIRKDESRSEAEQTQSEFAELLNPELAVADKKEDLNAEIERLVSRLEEMSRVAASLLAQRGAAASTGAELEAQEMHQQIRRTFAELDKIAAHVRSVDTAVAAMETAVTDQTRQKTLVTIKNTFSPISRLFGMETSNAVQPFVRPPQTKFDPL